MADVSPRRTRRNAVSTFPTRPPPPALSYPSSSSSSSNSSPSSSPNSSPSPSPPPKLPRSLQPLSQTRLTEVLVCPHAQATTNGRPQLCTGDETDEEVARQLANFSFAPATRAFRLGGAVDGWKSWEGDAGPRVECPHCEAAKRRPSQPPAAPARANRRSS